MTIDKPLQELQEVIMYDAAKVPDFLDSTKGSHHKVFCEMQRMLLSISKMCSYKFLNDDQLFVVLKEIDDSICEISAKRADNLIFLVFNHFQNLIMKYLQIAKENELYEVQANLTKFLEMYNA